MIKVAHLADLHFRRDRVQEITISLDAFEERARSEVVDLIAIAGDTWDGPTQNTAGAEFPFFLNRIRRLGDIAPVVMIYGTPSHDTAGSLDVFESLECRYGIHILQPGRAYFYNQEEREIYYEREDDEADDLLIFGVPEPNKKWLLSNQDAAGKETADLSAAQALKNLFLGLATIRQQTPDIPCLVMYHGRVTGATFANGQKIEDGIPADVLNMVDADYYALGDIHEPQAIPGHENARYVGSLYPCDWGEEHQPGWNLVKLGDWASAGKAGKFEMLERIKYEVERIDLPLAQQKHIKLRPDMAWKIGDVGGKKVWIEFICETASQINPDEVLPSLLESGALEGSRVTVKVKPTETVRAAEITEIQNLRDKVKLWADASDIEATDELLKAADDLEEEAAEHGVVTSSAHIRIDRLELCGAIGIWKGQRKEKVVLDLAGIDDGLIALVGENGAGKTTLIENLHPWPQMLTRSGKLQDQFMLKDSFRDLYFTDIRTGIGYRALLLIDGKNKSGSVEYYLYKRTSLGYEPIGDINGRQAPYLEAIDELFGSLPLFLKSAFISQRPSKNNPDLSDTTNAEKKELFAELAGIDYLAKYAEIAKGNAKAGEDEIIRTEAKLDAINSQLDQIPELKAKIDTGNTYLESVTTRRDELVFELKAATAALETARAADEQSRQTADKIGAKQKQLADIDKQTSSTERQIADFKTAAEQKEEAQNRITEHRRIEKQLSGLREKRSKIDREYLAEYQSWTELSKAVNAQVSGIKDKITDLKHLDSQVMADYRQTGAEREHAQKRLQELDSEKTCPTCGQDLPTSSIEKIDTQKRMYAIAVDQAREDEDRLLALHREYEDKTEGFNREMAGIIVPLEPVKLDTSNLDNQIRSASTDLEFSNLESAESVLRMAEEATIRIEELEKQLKVLMLQKAGIDSDLFELEAILDPGAAERYSEAQNRLEELTKEHTEVLSKHAAATARLEELNNQVKFLEAKQAETAGLIESLAHLKESGEIWRLLQKACGRDGIQALELDALAPSIADTANRILEAAYGSQFAIEFRTTRMAGSGSRQKQVETFDIIIHDSEDGTEQTLETLSGGESVWIKKAIYDAFGIIRARNTGIKFLTAIQDEADGALDPAAKERYFRMLEEAHKASGRHQTIIITHSREIQEMIQQTIDVSALAVQRVKGGAA